MRRWLLALLLFATPASAQIVNTLPFQLQNGTTADATQVMADFNQIVNNTNSNAAKNGVNSDITALTGLTTPLTPAQGGSTVYVGGTSSGTNTVVVATLSPNGFTLAAGKRVVFIAGGTNTGAVTLAAGGSAATNVFYPTPNGPQALIGGEIKTGNLIEVVFDGVQYQLVTNNLALLGPLTSISSATTTDLGTVPTHNVNITGVTTITSFGSTASITYPIYYITFAGAMQLTYNGTSMILPSQANITTAAGDTAVAQYLGGGNWKVWSYQRIVGTSVVSPTPMCGAQGLTITNNTGTPNSKIDITADQAVLINPTGNVPFYATSVSVTINDTVNGANGLDSGSLANNTFYHHYLISDGSTVAGLDSASATAPTMPGGYVYKCRLGASKTNGSANFYGFLTKGNSTQYINGGNGLTVLPVVVSGSVGSNCVSSNPSTWQAEVVQGASGAAPLWYPPTATSVDVVAWGGASNQYANVAPNNTYGGSNTGNPAPCSPALGTAGGSNSMTCRLTLESTSIYVCSSGGSVAAFRWQDKVNAN